MQYTIYKTTNLLNGKIYIGKHQTKNPNDSYLGSGRYLLSAIRKAGRENFKKEVLFVFDSEEEMNCKEKELIDEEFVARCDTYNIGVGGEGGAHFKGKKHLDETREKIRRTSSLRVTSDETKKKQRGKKHSQETKDKIALAASKRRLSEQSKQKISESLKRRSNLIAE